MRTKKQNWGLALGPVLGLLAAALVPDHYVFEGSTFELGRASAVTACLAVWMAVWWFTEAIEIFATALLPLIVLPLGGGAKISEISAPYAHEIIFLFFGGFALSLAMERCGLHRRIAVRMIAWFGSQPSRLIAGFMCATAFLSMWISNTATALMLLPIALSLSSDDDSAPLQVPLLLSIAYAASIGGVATIIGTPPNTFLVSFVRDQMGVDIGFVDWMLFGVPLSLVMLLLTWWLLTRVIHPIDRSVPISVPVTSGSATTMQRWVMVVFVATVLLWVSRKWIQSWVVGGGQPFSGISDAGIAMTAAMALFAVPMGMGKFALDWETMRRMPWGILILFGGGLSLARAMDAYGVASYLGSLMSGLSFLPGWLVLLLVIVLVVFLTELTSNTATTAALVPIFAAIAPNLNMDSLVVAIAVAISASYAFMLPVATPPNAIVFSSGRLTMQQMARAGLYLNLFGIAAIYVCMYWVVTPMHP
ncbi:MAG: SLC13/DASS family transporter [Acidobacteria bacterium]|nr:SLC13/DASS family transporter [Acidobacteriota bacterium]